MLYKKIEEKKNMHSIRIYFGFNVLRSASKLKRGVIEKKLVGAFGFPYSWIFLPPIFLLLVLFLPWIVMGTFSVNPFQSYLFYILYDTPLVYVFMNLFSNVIFCVCCFSLSQPDVNITWITGHIHRSIVDKIDPTSYIKIM